jgi:hypothetical protein
MKQYSVYYMGDYIESTGYFDSISKVRSFLKKRYSDVSLITFRAVYPVFEKKVYKV